MKHVIDGVCGALAVFAPLQDGHSRVQMEMESASAKVPERKRLQASERKVYTAPLQYISHPFLSSCYSKRKKKGTRCCGACDEG